jgi:uncharacterized membrane protein YeaQ/YmgE (transglycosylase-associated protein family)
MTHSTIVFPVLLCAYLILSSIGQWLGGQYADRYNNRLDLGVAVFFTTGALLLLAALRLPAEWAARLQGLRFTTFNGSLLSAEHGNLIGDASPITVFIFSAGMMLSVIPWSGLFTIMFRLVTKSTEDAGSQFARIYTLDTIGSMVGTYICGMFMLSALGTGISAMITVIVSAIGVLIIICSKKYEGKISRSALAVLIIGCLTVIAMPLNYYMSFKFDNYQVIDVFEGRTGVASVVPTEKFYYIVDFDRTASASALFRDPEPQDEYEAWRWNHSELMALDSSFRPKSVLIIGLGHGYLIDAMLDYDFIEKITVVDLSQEIVSAVEAYTSTSTMRIFNDSRVEIIIDDGRRFIQDAISRGEKYDLIQNKINEPWHAGSGNLFTQEFFLIKKELLSPGGYLSTRPLTGHLNDGLKVFGNALWCGYYHMYFKNGDAVLPEQASITADILAAWNADLPGSGNVFHNPRASFINAVLFTDVPESLKTDANTDNHPTFEYYWFRQVTDSWVSPRVSLLDVDTESYAKQIPINTHQ